MQYGKIKIQTLNVWHGQYEFENRMNSLARRIKIDMPDVLCLQEIIFYPDGSNTAQWIANQTGMFLASAHPQPNTINMEGATIGNAILTRMPVKENGFKSLAVNVVRPMNSSVVWFWTETPVSRKPMLVLSTHLSWGIANEYQRLQEAIEINNIAKELTKYKPNSVVVLAGTMNTTPDTDTIRFLTGKKAMSGAENFWVDCWADTEGDSLGETQTPRNLWIRIPAEETGTVDIARIPKRRIDYIFVRDWVYGQTGSPLTSKVCFTEPMKIGNVPTAPVSDHYGVETTLLDVL
jgi:endonuclease/exonuclease/phosphatase family metal-dependent hydrolase